MIRRLLASMYSRDRAGAADASLAQRAPLSPSARPTAQYRQGDLLFVRHPMIPTGSLVRRDGVIERGELTGHAHRLVGGVVLDLNGRVYLEAGADAQIVHEEHAPLALPEGSYVVIRQREYRGEEESTRVRD